MTEFEIEPCKLVPAKLNKNPTLLLGPGPANVPNRVLQSMAMNTLSHLHPEFLAMMDEVKYMLQYVFQTKNAYTFAINGSGSCAMEMSVVNLLEPNDVLLVVANGYWGDRITDVSKRAGVIVQRIELPAGQVADQTTISEALEKHKPKALFVVHGESSVGVCHPIDYIGSECRKHNCLLIVDAVVTCGGAPLLTDRWNVDCVYSGGQKCLMSPPGVSPISFSDRAIEVIKSRKTPVQSYYLDALLIGRYWNCSPNETRIYHHTNAINNIYAMRESLMIICEEGLQNRWKTHQAVATLIYEGLTRLGLKFFIEEKYRLRPLTVVCAPEGINPLDVQKYIFTKYNIEIAGGLGPTAGKVWRIGLMGFNARSENAHIFLSAFEDALNHFGK